MPASLFDRPSNSLGFNGDGRKLSAVFCLISAMLSMVAALWILQMTVYWKVIYIYIAVYLYHSYYIIVKSISHYCLFLFMLYLCSLMNIMKFRPVFLISVLILFL